MIQYFKKNLFGKNGETYQKWLFPQNKSILGFGLIANIVMMAVLSVGDFYYFEKELNGLSFFDWALYTDNFARVTLYPIITLGAVFLSMSSWNNSSRRLEWIGVSNILFAYLASFYSSITIDYITANEHSYGVLPLIIFCQLLYGLRFKTSFFLSFGMVLFTIAYSIVDGTPLSEGIWIIALFILTWISLVIANLKLEQYRIQNFLTISKLTNAQQKIEEQKHLLLAGETVSQMFSWKTSKDFKNISFSDGVYDIYEIGKSISDVSKIVNIMTHSVVPEHQEMVNKSMAIFLKGNLVDFPIYKINLSNGKTKWLKTSIEKRNDESFLYGSIQDVTTEKELELELKKHSQELQTQSKELQSRNEDLEQFAYASSHDLQEPLRTITNFARILNKKIDHQLTEETRNYMSLIVESTTRMSKLITDILEYSQIGKHKIFQEFDSKIIVENVIKDLNYSLEKSGGNVIIENKLPTIIGLQTEFATLVQNIIGNALKFQREGVRPIVIVRSYTDINSYHFSIQDNGIGMEQKDADKIFGLFSRLHGKDEYKGTGIGLTHSKKIVELHGGKIWVESVKGKGTTFHFNISKGIGENVSEKESDLQLVDN